LPFADPDIVPTIPGHCLAIYTVAVATGPDQPWIIARVVLENAPLYAVLQGEICVVLEGDIVPPDVIALIRSRHAEGGGEGDMLAPGGGISLDQIMIGRSNQSEPVTPRGLIADPARTVRVLPIQIIVLNDAITRAIQTEGRVVAPPAVE
jgi:hypothetical protein